MISLILSIITVIATVLIAFFTERTWKTQKIAITPEISIFLRSEDSLNNEYDREHQGFTTDICVKNVGQRVVLNMKFGENLSVVPYERPNDGEHFNSPIHAIDFITDGISSLDPGQEISSHAAVYSPGTHSLVKGECKVNVTATYKDSRGKVYSAGPFPLDFRNPRFQCANHE